MHKYLKVPRFFIVPASIEVELPCNKHHNTGRPIYNTCLVQKYAPKHRMLPLSPSVADGGGDDDATMV